MRIIAKESGGRGINLILPTGLVLNRLTAGVAVKALQGQGITVSRESVLALLRALRQYRKTHPQWVLVEAKSSSGEYTKIKL